MSPGTRIGVFEVTAPIGDGPRFLALVDAGITPRLTVVLNWRARSGQ